MASPTSVRDLVELDGLPPRLASFLRRLQPDLRFLLDDLAAGGEERIEARQLSDVVDLSLRFLQVLRHRSPRDAGAAMDRWRHVVQRVLAEARGREVLRALWSWYLAPFPAGEQAVRTVMAHIRDSTTRQTMKSALDELLEEGFTKGLAKGREEGREEGREVGQRELLRRQLAQRFGAIPGDLDARLANASAADVEAWSLRVLTAASIADVFHGE